MGILQNKRSRLKLAASGIVFIIVLSFASVLSSAQNASDIPLRRDVLLVRLGNEEAPIRTFTIIDRFLNDLDELMLSSGTHDVDFGLKSRVFIQTSIQCTQSIHRETPKSKLAVEVIQTSISSFDIDISHFKASIIIVVGHGSELGIVEERDSNSISWEDTVETTTKVQPQLTILASCFSSNAVSLGQNIIGFNGVVDALLVGHIVSLLLAQVIPNTPNTVIKDTLNSAMDRCKAVLLDETVLLPLSIQSDWASVRIPLVAVLSGLFFICAYYTMWAAESALASVAGAILVGAAGVVIGGLFQLFLELIRTTIGSFLMAINYQMGKIFNAVIGTFLGFSISYLSSLLLPSVLSAALYAITGTSVALALANTPLPWIRAAACLAAAIGLISTFDVFVQLL